MAHAAMVGKPQQHIRFAAAFRAGDQHPVKKCPEKDHSEPIINNPPPENDHRHRHDHDAKKTAKNQLVVFGSDSQKRPAVHAFTRGCDSLDAAADPPPSDGRPFFVPGTVDPGHLALYPVNVHKSPETAVEAVVTVIAHDEELTRRNRYRIEVVAWMRRCWKNSRVRMDRVVLFDQRAIGRENRPRFQWCCRITP
jgi:hypothetical protein